MSELFTNNLVWTGGAQTNWSGLLNIAKNALGDAGRFADHRVLFVVDDNRQALAAVIYGLTNCLDWGVIERSRLTPEVEVRCYENGVWPVPIAGSATVTAPATVDHVHGRITVLTSGSTGLLKLIAHDRETLNTFDRMKQADTQTWFLPFQIGSYAWYQMVMLGLLVERQNLYAAETGDLAASFERALATGQITAISSTPTFWRFVLLATDRDVLQVSPINSISIGGEVVDQAILDQLRNIYPKAIIRHIYASSETGAAIVVSDGLAGFPVRVLNDPQRKIGVKVEDGRLFIRSKYCTRTSGGDWVDTGDLIEIRNDRVYFCGRSGTTMINVGGQKAFTHDVEAHLMSHPTVAWTKVTARKAPLVGHLPIAAVVLKAPMEQEQAEQMLVAHCTGKLADYAIPRLWQFLEGIPLSSSLKS
ncbi:AMP-binding protein [Aestuariivirga sp.]|uniref:AMP-binding protein n=1 Tax=Aestuariivirga sp. TaxID=2650926 RepID=UPI0035945F01